MLSSRTSRDAEVFASALERTNFDKLSVELLELLELTQRLENSATVEPAEDFRIGLRERLMTEAEATLVPQRRTRKPENQRARKRLAAALTSALIVSGGAGLAASSASALPGDMLYPVKRGIESAQSVLPSQDAAFDLKRAEARLAEAVALSNAGDEPQLLTQALDAFAEATHNAATQYNEASSNAALRRLSTFADISGGQLLSIQHELPAIATAAWRHAMTQIDAVTDRVARLCADCNIADVDETASALRDSVQHRAAQDVTETDRDTEQEESTAQEAPPTAAQTPDAQPQPTARAPKSSEQKPAPRQQKPKTAKESGGLLEPVLGLLVGNEKTPGLLGGLLGGSK